MHLGIPILATIVSVGIGFVVAQTDSKLRSPITERSHSIEQFVHVSTEASAVFSKSCGDCHSNNTQWTWYSYIPYVGVRLQTDVRKGRGRFNLSDWPALVREGPEEMVGRVIAVCDEVELEEHAATTLYAFASCRQAHSARPEDIVWLVSNNAT